MTHFDTVQRLVQTLNKAERKALSGIAGSNRERKSYMILYTILLKADIDSREAKARFATQCPGVSYQVALNWLYNRILKTIRQLAGDYDLESRLLNQYMDAKLLFAKGLYYQGFELLERAKRLAEENQMYDIYIKVSKLQLHYSVQMQATAMSETTLATIQGEVARYRRYEMSAHEHRSLYQLLLWRYLNQGAVAEKGEFNRLNDLVISEISLISRLGSDSFEAQKTHLLFQSLYCLMTGDLNSALGVFSELESLFEAHIHLRPDPPFHYIEHIRGMMTALRSQGDYEKIPHLGARLRNLRSRHETVNEITAELAFQYEIIPRIDRGEFREALHLVDNEAKNHQSLLQRLPSEIGLSGLFYRQMVHFGLGNYKKVVQQLAQLVLTRQAEGNMVINSALRILYILAHYEAGHVVQVQYELKTYARELRQGHKQSFVIGVFVNTLNQLCVTPSREIRRNILRSGREKIESHSLQRFDNQLLVETALLVWMRAHESGQKFAQVLRDGTGSREGKSHLK